MIPRLDSLLSGDRNRSLRAPVAQPARPFAVVVAAVDAAGPRARSRRVLEVAQALGRGGGRRAALHVVYGWTLVGDSILACPIRGISPDRLRALRSNVGRLHRERVRELCDDVLPSRPDGILVRRGDPRVVIPEVARRLGADLVVVGGGSDAGFGRLLLGSVARAVVDRVSCDVVTVRGSYPW